MLHTLLQRTGNVGLQHGQSVHSSRCGSNTFAEDVKSFRAAGMAGKPPLTASQLSVFAWINHAQTPRRRRRSGQRR
jgi:hypothetical protein